MSNVSDSSDGSIAGCLAGFPTDRVWTGVSQLCSISFFENFEVGAKMDAEDKEW